MRLFVAVPLALDVRECIGKYVSSVAKNISAVKWVKAENYHVTLKFIGEVSRERDAAIHDALRMISRQTQSFPVQFSGIGAFPHLMRPSIVWVGVSVGQEALASLAGRMEGAMAPLDFPIEERAFHAHVTIGRVSHRGSFQNPIGLDGETGAVRDFGSQTVDSLDLMESVLRPEGPQYHKRVSFTLNVGRPS